jgi:uncharacterized damage-inducible protein DinB
MSEARFVEEMRETLAKNHRKIETCLELLTEEQVWWRPNQRSNSVGNQLLHLFGNLSQWILAGLGGLPYTRRRSLEFTSGAETGDKRELLRRLDSVVSGCSKVAASMTSEALRAPHRIQGCDTDGLGALFHAVDHMTYHTAQVVFIAKQLVDDSVEIEFYPQHRNE